MSVEYKTVTPPDHPELWGFILDMLQPESELPMWEQVDKGYRHGGGWQDFDQFDVTKNEDGTYTMTYPGDPPLQQRDNIIFGDEMLVMFSYSWILWVKGDEQKVARID